VAITAAEARSPVQEVWLVGTAALSGTFTLRFAGQPPPTGPVALAWDAPAGAVAAAVERLAGAGSGVVVTRGRSGVRGFVWTVTFATAASASGGGGSGGVFGFGGSFPSLAAASVDLAVGGGGSFDLAVVVVETGVRALEGTFFLQAFPFGRFVDRFDFAAGADEAAWPGDHLGDGARVTRPIAVDASSSQVGFGVSPAS
jgi:hypothetical protein